jgi:hypothetical protein
VYVLDQSFHTNFLVVSSVIWQSQEPGTERVAADCQGHSAFPTCLKCMIKIFTINCLRPTAANADDIYEQVVQLSKQWSRNNWKKKKRAWLFYMMAEWKKVYTNR